jgi:hypothetical protein
MIDSDIRKEQRQDEIRQYCATKTTKGKPMINGQVPLCDFADAACILVQPVWM